VPEDVKDDDNSLDAVLSKTLENYSEDAPVEAAPAVDDDTPAARDDGRDEQGRFKSKQAEGGVDAPAAEVPAVEGQPPADATPAPEAPKAAPWNGSKRRKRFLTANWQRRETSERRPNLF
jgi:hypothetical protein